MKVSVVIPAYNEEKLIVRCLNALKKQTLKPFEIIVVDNNSSDNTAKFAREMGVKVITQKKQGTIFARDLGFNTAKGDIIARIDADTTVPKNWIEDLTKHFVQNPNLIALSGPTVFEDNKFNNLLIAEKPFLVTWRLLFGHDVLYGPNMALTKKAWDKIKNNVCLTDKEVHEDFDVAIHLGDINEGEILFDKDFKVTVSERRWRDKKSYYEYPERYLKTIVKHKKII